MSESAASGHPLASFAGRAKEGPWLSYVGHLVSILARGKDTGGQFSAMEAIVRKGYEPPHHVHDHDDEAYYVIEGQFTFRIGEEVVEAGPGDMVFLPKGVPHSWTVEESGARTLWLAMPGGIDEYFEEMSEAVDSYELPEPPESLPLERMGALLSGKYGIHLVGPKEPHDKPKAGVS